MDTKVLLCGSACRRKSPWVNSEILGKEQSQSPEVPQKLSFGLAWFSPWPDSAPAISDTESWVRPFQWITVFHYSWSCCWFWLVVTQTKTRFAAGQNLLTSAHFRIHFVSCNTELPFLFYCCTLENAYMGQRLEEHSACLCKSLFH